MMPEHLHFLMVKLFEISGDTSFPLSRVVQLCVQQCVEHETVW